MEEKKQFHEPKLSELEQSLESFRRAHGQDKLMEAVKSITSKKPHIEKKQPKDTNNEPKISELEHIFHIFKEKHGHEKLKSSLKEATANIEKKHVVYKNNSEKSAAPRSFKDYLNKTYIFIKNVLKRKRYRYPTIALGVFLGIYMLFNLPIIYSRINWKKPNIQKTVVKSQEVVQKKMADSAALAPGEVIPAESRIIIPKINVNAPIIYADTRDEKGIENLLHNGVVQYQGTAKPGEVGNSFITGHSSNYWWDTGKYNYVFVLLDKMEPGDQAVVYYNNKKFVYTVRDKVVVEATDVSVLAPTETPVLSLMTCTPPGTSWKRLVVRLDMTDPVYYKPETVTKEKVVETPKPKEEKKSFFSNIFSFFTPN